MAHHPAVALLQAEWNQEETGVDHSKDGICPLCQGRFYIAFGRHKKIWLMLHPNNGKCKLSSQFLRPHAATKEQAVAHIAELK